MKRGIAPRPSLLGAAAAIFIGIPMVQGNSNLGLFGSRLNAQRWTSPPLELGLTSVRPSVFIDLLDVAC